MELFANSGGFEAVVPRADKRCPGPDHLRAPLDVGPSLFATALQSEPLKPAPKNNVRNARDRVSPKPEFPVRQSDAPYCRIFVNVN